MSNVQKCIKRCKTCLELSFTCNICAPLFIHAPPPFLLRLLQHTSGAGTPMTATASPGPPIAAYVQKSCPHKLTHSVRQPRISNKMYRYFSKHQNLYNLLEIDAEMRAKTKKKETNTSGSTGKRTSKFIYPSTSIGIILF